MSFVPTITPGMLSARLQTFDSEAQIPQRPLTPLQINDDASSIEQPRYKTTRNQKILIGLGLGVLAIAGGGVGAYFAIPKKHTTTQPLPGLPVASPSATSIRTTPIATSSAVASARPSGGAVTIVAAYNKAFKTNYDNSNTGLAALQALSLGDFTTPHLFAAYACSASQANTSCTLSQALQGNAMQVNLPLIMANEDLNQTSVSLAARCDSGSNTKVQTFLAPLPKVSTGQTSRGFFSLLNSPDAVCTTNTGASLFNFHYNLTVRGQTVGANNSIVLFKRNAAGQITNALIGVSSEGGTDAMYFNAPIYNLQTSY